MATAAPPVPGSLLAAAAGNPPRRVAGAPRALATGAPRPGLKDAPTGALAPVDLPSAIRMLSHLMAAAAALLKPLEPAAAMNPAVVLRTAVASAGSLPAQSPARAAQAVGAATAGVLPVLLDSMNSRTVALLDQAGPLQAVAPVDFLLRESGGPGVPPTPRWR